MEYYTGGRGQARGGDERLDPHSGPFDGVIDFDAVLRDPADPLLLNPAYDSGDHLYPDDAGYEAMNVNAISLEMLLPKPR